MADPNETVHVPGAHYSGKNKIPTVNQFLERLDRDKKDRDKAIDEQNKQQTTQSTSTPNKSAPQQQDGDAVPHQNKELTVKGSQLL